MEVLLIIGLLFCAIPLFILGIIFLRYRKMFKAIKSVQSGSDLDSLLESFMGKNAKDSPLIKTLLEKANKKNVNNKKEIKKSGPIEYAKDQSTEVEDAEFRDS